MKILLTGATGYLGYQVADNLISKDYQIACIVRNKERLGKLLLKEKGPELIEVGNSLEKKVSDFSPDCVINIAGAYRGGTYSDSEMFNSNLSFPFRILQCAITRGISRWINVDTALPATLNAYALSKSQLVEWGRFYSKETFQFVNLKVEQFYGVGQSKAYFIPWVIENLKTNKRLPLTAGTQKRDLVYVKDVVRVITASISWKTSESFCEVPVGTGDSPTIKEVVEYLKEEMHSSSILDFGAVPMRKGEPNSNCDITIINSMGITEMMHWKQGMNLLLK